MAIKAVEKTENESSGIDLESMSVAQLKSLIADAQKLIDKKYESEKADALAKMRQLASASGFTLEEIIPGLGAPASSERRIRKPMKPKYQHPDDDNVTWTGVGKAPRWVTEYEAGGGSRDDLLIAS